MKQVCLAYETTVSKARKGVSEAVDVFVEEVVGVITIAFEQRGNGILLFL